MRAEQPMEPSPCAFLRPSYKKTEPSDICNDRRCAHPPPCMSVLTFSHFLPHPFPDDEYGAEGGAEGGGSFQGPQSPAHSQSSTGYDQGPGPGYGAEGPGAPGFGQGSGAMGPPPSNYNSIHVPPGSHAPANTPADLPPPAGTTHPHTHLHTPIYTSAEFVSEQFVSLVACNPGLLLSENISLDGSLVQSLTRWHIWTTARGRNAALALSLTAPSDAA